MANKEISELTNKATPVGTDEFEIQESGGGASKKTSLQAIWDNIKTNSISEKTSGTGVTIDGVLLKDGNVDGTLGATTPASVSGTTGSFSGQTVVNTSGGSLVATPSTFYDDLVVQNATSATGSGITILANATNGFGGVKFGDSGGANQFGVGFDCSTNRGFIDVAGSEALGFDSSRNAKFSNIVYIGSNDSYLQESGGDLFLGSGGSGTLQLTASDSALFSADVGVASGSILSVGYASASTSGASLQVNGDCAVDGELVLNEQYIQNTGISGTVWGLTIANTSSRSGINFIGPSSTSAQIAYGSNGGSIGNDDLAFEGFNEIFMNLPTSAGTTGSLWNDSGTVKVA